MPGDTSIEPSERESWYFSRGKVNPPEPGSIQICWGTRSNFPRFMDSQIWTFLRQSKTLEDAFCWWQKTVLARRFDALRHHQLANCNWPTDDDAERRNVLPKSSFVINKASSSVLLRLNHNHEGDIEKVVWVSGRFCQNKHTKPHVGQMCWWYWGST